MKKRYPKNASELIGELKRRQKEDEKKYPKRYAEAIRRMEKYQDEALARQQERQAEFPAHRKMQRWPMQFSRLEYKGKSVRSVVRYFCHCGIVGELSSITEDARDMVSIQCNQCGCDAPFTFVTNLR